MITVYSATASDYSNNGLMSLDRYCISAIIHEKLNGEYRLHMELLISERTVQIAPEMVVKVPAPVRFTPKLDIYEDAPSKVYKVVTSGLRLNLRTKPDLQKGKVLHSYPSGTEVIVTDDTSHDDWYAVAAPDGRSGWMWAGNLTYVRTDNAAPSESGIREQTAREQLFRISSISKTLDCISIDAQHISYDLRRNYVRTVSAKGKTGAEAFSSLLAAAVTPHEFTGYSDVQTIIEEEIERRSPIAAILSDGGLIEQAGGELLRDNFDLYWFEKIGQNRGVSIAYRKNMAGMDVRIDTSDLVTRIIPVGFDKKGNPIYGDPVDSPHINEYAQPYVVEYEYKDVAIGKNDLKDKNAVLAELAKRAAAEYESGIDVPKVTASVDYVDIQNTDAAKNFQAFVGVFLGDTISLRHEDYGMDFIVKVAAYEWDCLRSEYIGIELGSHVEQLSDVRISPAQIGNGTLSGRKLAAGTVSGVELGEGVITDEHINVSGITGEKIIGAVSEVDTKNGIRINGKGVYVTGGEIDLRTNDGEQFLNITPESVEASSVRAGDVAPRYDGGRVLVIDKDASSEAMEAGGTYRSISDAFAALSGKQLSGEVVIRCEEGMTEYGDMVLEGVCGGQVTVYGADAVLYGGLTVRACSGRVWLEGLKVASESGGLNVDGGAYVRMKSCSVSGANGDAVTVSAGARVYAEECTLIAAVNGRAAWVTDAAFGVFVDCIGNGALAVRFGSLAASGKVPSGGCVNEGGAILSAEGVTPTSADGEPSVPQVQTAVYTMTHSDSYAGGGWSWFADDDIRQGMTGNSGRIRGCIWFDAAAIREELTGKTVNQVSLRLKMQSGVGRGVAVSVQLYGTNMAYEGHTGAPELVTSYGTIGSVSPNEMNVITLPNQVAQDLADGTICALVLRSDDEELYNGRSYSRNYARFDGETSGTEESVPMLTVKYN